MENWIYRQEGPDIYMSRPDGSQQRKWSLDDAEENLEFCDDSLFKYDDLIGKDFIYYDGWIYMTQGWCIGDGHEDEDNYSVGRMRPDGSSPEELFSVSCIDVIAELGEAAQECDPATDVHLHISDISDGWVYFEAVCAFAGKIRYKMRPDGTDVKKLSENGSDTGGNGTGEKDTGGSDNDAGDIEQKHKTAIENYERLMATKPSVYEPKLAEECSELATLYFHESRFDEAKEQFERAEDIYYRLVLGTPGLYEPEYDQNCCALAWLYDMENSSGKAEVQYRNSIRMFERLDESWRNIYRDRYAKTVYLLADFLHGKEMYDEAEPEYHKLIPLREKIAEECPIKQCEDDLALALNNLGSLYRVTGRYDECEPLYDRALSISKKLAGDYPEDDLFQNRLASQLYRLGLLYEMTNRPDEAHEAWQQAYDIWSAMSDEGIDDFDFRELFRATEIKLTQSPLPL